MVLFTDWEKNTAFRVSPDEQPEVIMGITLSCQASFQCIVISFSGWPFLSTGHPSEWSPDAGGYSETAPGGEKDCGSGHTQTAVPASCRLGIVLLFLFIDENGFYLVFFFSRFGFSKLGLPLSNKFQTNKLEATHSCSVSCIMKGLLLHLSPSFCATDWWRYGCLPFQECLLLSS